MSQPPCLCGGLTHSTAPGLEAAPHTLGREREAGGYVLYNSQTEVTGNAGKGGRGWRKRGGGAGLWQKERRREKEKTWYNLKGQCLEIFSLFFCNSIWEPYLYAEVLHIVSILRRSLRCY